MKSHQIVRNPRKWHQEALWLDFWNFGSFRWNSLKNPATVAILAGSVAILMIFFAGCAENAPKLTHWARLDGLRKAQHAWIETDFRQSEHYCELAAGSHSNADPQFSYPQVRTTAGADLEIGMANIVRGETIRANRETAFELCMMRSGYFVEYSE